MDWWHDRLSGLTWYFDHLNEVRSDFSVFHRVDDIDSLTASTFLPRMELLKSYPGAVAYAIAREQGPTFSEPPFQFVDEQEHQRLNEGQPSTVEVANGRVASAADLQKMNASAAYGPGAGQSVPMFEVVTV